MNRLKGPHIKMRSVRFTKRTSCWSVGPGAKPMRSEPKVDPEASGKFYGDTGIPRPFTVLFLGTIGVGWLEPFVRRVLVDFLTGLRPRSVSGGFCTSRASGVLDSGSFLGHGGPVGLSGLVAGLFCTWVLGLCSLSFVLKPGRMNTVGHGVHYVVMSGRMGFASLPDSFLGSLEGYHSPKRFRENEPRTPSSHARLARFSLTDMMQVTVSSWKCVYSRKQDPSRRAFTQTFSCEGEARLLSMNLSNSGRDKCLQAVFMETRREFSPVSKQNSRNKIRKAKLNMEIKTNSTKQHGKNGIKPSSTKGRPVTGLTILQPFRGYQREFVSVRLYQKGFLVCSSAIWWSNPFVVDPIAASWHIVSAGSLVVYCWWSRIPPAGGQGPIRPVIEEHFAVPSLNPVQE
ncbi:hypothetical protein F4703DRAFT_1919098 [Phycomyces blakesleeanus]